MNGLNKQGWRSRFINIICWAFFALFMYAAFTKLMAYGKFVATIGQSAMLTPYAGILAWAVPSVEIVIALMLRFDRTRLPGLYASLSLMVMFTAYIFIMLGFTDSKPCGCGGLIEAMGWGWHLVFNFGFVVAAIIGIILHTVISNRRERSLVAALPSR